MMTLGDNHGCYLELDILVAPLDLQLLLRLLKSPSDCLDLLALDILILTTAYSISIVEYAGWKALLVGFPVSLYSFEGHILHCRNDLIGFSIDFLIFSALTTGTHLFALFA